MSEDTAQRVAQANALIEQAYALLDWDHPVGKVRWVHVDEVQANDYNPNAVAFQEMKLLHTSISEDGYTQPVVTIIEHRVDIVLPCGHLSTLDQKHAQYLKALCWGTQQDSLTAREASLPLSASHIDTHDGVSRSASPTPTMDETSPNGSGTSGVSATSTSRTGFATPTSGTSRVSGMSDTSWEHVCPICASSRSEPEACWLSSRLNPGDSTEDGGPRVSWRSSDSTGNSLSETSPGHLVGALSPFDTSAVVSDKSKAIIVDGFHRYTVMKKYEDIYSSSRGYLPIVVIEKSIEQRIASTVRHNRARGKHSVAGMGNLVFQLLSEGVPDVEICQKLGMEAEELARLKHITGYSKLYAAVDTYSRPMATAAQLKAKAAYQKEHPDESVPANL